MNEEKESAELAALREAALEDILAASDADLRKEALEDGQDIKELASKIRTTMRVSAGAALRRRLAQAKARDVLGPPVVPIGGRPLLEDIKRRITEVFASNPKLGLAYRDGKKQSDVDWQSLYDDLVAMGEIKPSDDGI